MIVVEELVEEVASGKAKATIKMGGEDNKLTGLWLRCDFLAGNPALDPYRNPPLVN